MPACTSADRKPSRLSTSSCGPHVVEALTVSHVEVVALRHRGTRADDRLSKFEATRRFVQATGEKASTLERAILVPSSDDQDMYPPIDEPATPTCSRSLAAR